MKANECKCCKCGKQAYAFWPMIDPDIPSYAFCKTHLREIQMGILIDVFGKEKGEKIYHTNKKNRKEINNENHHNTPKAQ